MHVAIFGPTRCGKSTLARALAAEYVKQGRAVLVCDPLDETWPGASWQTISAAALIAKAKTSRNCVLFVEEASLSIQRDRSLSWLFTTAGNPRAGGHLVYVIGQDGASLLPAQRQQLSTIYLFRCHPDAAETWARQLAQPELATKTSTLDRFEFVIARPFEPLRVCRLTRPNPPP